MKIIHFTHTYTEPNGISYYLQGLVQNTPKEHECEVVFGKGFSPPFFSSLKFPVGEFFQLLKADGDLVHVHGYGNFFSFFGAIGAILKNKPLVWSIYGYPRMKGIRKLAYWAYRYLMAPLIFWKAGAITSNSNEAIKFLKNETKKEILFLPNGIDLDFFKPKEGYRRQKLVGFVGRLDPDKNVFRMFECKSFPLIFLGKDEDGTKAKLQEYVKQNSVQAQFVEVERKEVPSIYEKCKYVVLPSKYEGLPMTMFESIAMERPFICTDVGEVKNMMGELFGDPKIYLLEGNIQEKLDELEMMDLSEQMKEARKRLEKYSWKKIGARTADVYSEINAATKKKSD